MAEWTYRYLGNYPKNRETGWSDELQGVTHDADHWFFSQSKSIWRMHVSHDLNRPVEKRAARAGGNVIDMPRELAARGYDHFGDLHHHEGYLFAPVTGKEAPARGHPVIAVFRAPSLRYVGCSYLAEDSAIGEAQRSAGWCALDPSTGRLYTSNNTVSSEDPLYVYDIHFDALSLTEIVAPFTLERRQTLYDGDGRPVTMKHMQGGVISEDGILYTVNGYYENCDPKECGIRLFDLTTGYLVGRSSTENEPFRFSFKPTGRRNEEPEGVTLWDLEKDDRAPNIGGQLHVILLDNDADEDDLYFKHYAGPTPIR